MITRFSPGIALVSLVAIFVQACSGSQGGDGTVAAGGASGGNPVGGSTSAGGSTSIGGSNLGQGGTTATGGANGIGGATGTGGATTIGGATGTGGATAIGGATAAGGATGTGGATSAGGATGTGGARTGGATSAGGARTGGATSTGGATGTGGATSTGGASATGGAATGTGGASTGTPVCGTAAEAASTTLTCPTGQIITAVTFASYGNPTGSCGSFATGSCNAVASLTRVKSICVGRNSCKVTASNNTFGDPCNSTVKNLSIQVSCAAGTPLIGTNSPYKGVANSPASEIAALGATWCYNWMTGPQASDCADPLFVPMVWGGGSVASAIAAIGNAGYKTVLGFNEPNKTDQANMTVASAIALWPTLTSNANIRVSSPAVSDDGRAWLEDFMTQANAGGLRVDFIAMHWYGWNAGSCTSGSLMGAVNWASKWGLPVWITEFGCMGSSNPDEATLLNFFKTAIPALANSPLVERYAWYPWNTYNHLYTSGTMTALGSAFAAAPKYR